MSLVPASHDGMDLYDGVDSRHMLVPRHCFCRLIFFAFSRDASFIVIAIDCPTCTVCRPIFHGYPPRRVQTSAGGVRQVEAMSPCPRKTLDNKEMGE